MDTETITDPREGALALLSAWESVSVRDYGAYWVISGLCLDFVPPKVFDTHTDHQPDKRDPVEGARRLLATAAQERQKLESAVSADEPPPSINLTDGSDPENQAAEAAQHDDVSELGPSAEPGDGGDAVQPDASGVDDSGLVQPDMAGEAGGDAAAVAYAGTAFGQDEISALRADLMAQVDAVAAERIQAVTPDEAAEASRLAYLRNGLMLGVLNDAERAEADRLEAHVGWREATRAHATALKEEIVFADVDLLRVFDPEDGWPDPPG